MYEYKAIPFLAEVSSRDRRSAERASAQLTKEINANAVDGWEFYQLNSLSVVVSPGCLGALTGSKPGTLFIDEMIFRHEKA